MSRQHETVLLTGTYLHTMCTTYARNHFTVQVSN